MRKIASAAAVVCLALAAGCGSLGQDKGVSASGSTPAGQTATAAASSAAHSGPKRATFGQLLTVTGGGADIGKVSVTGPTLDSSLDDGFTTPKNGQTFTSFKVTFRATKPGLDYNPFDWYVRAPDGSHLDPTYGKDPQLASGTLAVGELTSGWLTFDAGAHGTLVFSPNLAGTSLAEWAF